MTTLKRKRKAKCDVHRQSEQMRNWLTKPKPTKFMPPVSFKVFTQLVENLKDIAFQVQVSEINKHNCTLDECANWFYNEFYTNLAIRSKYQIRVKSCPQAIKTKLLQFPPNVETPTAGPDQAELGVEVTVKKSGRFLFPVEFATFKQYINEQRAFDFLTRKKTEKERNSLLGDAKKYAHLLRKGYNMFYMFPRRRSKDFEFKEAPQALLEQLLKPGVPLDEMAAKSVNEKPKADQLKTTSLTSQASKLMQSLSSIVSFDVFEKYIKNLYDIIWRLKLNDSEYKNMGFEDCAKSYYIAFYLTPEIRGRIPYEFVPCTTAMRDRLLALPNEQDVLTLLEVQKLSQEIATSQELEKHVISPPVEPMEVVDPPEIACEVQLPYVEIEASTVSPLNADKTESGGVKFAQFKRYIKNLDSIVSEMLSCVEYRGKSRDECALEYFRAFYTSSEIRERFKYELKPCPAKMREKLLALPVQKEEKVQIVQKEVPKEEIIIKIKGVDYAYPVDLKTFLRYVNYYELRQQLVDAHAKNKPNGDEANEVKLFKRFYYSFYLEKSLRNQFNCNFNAAPAELRSKLMEMAIPLTEKDKELPQQVANMEFVPATQMCEAQELQLLESTSCPNKEITCSDCELDVVEDIGKSGRFRFPVSFESFKRCINYDELLHPLLMHVTQQNSELADWIEQTDPAQCHKVFTRFYRSFYVRPIVRTQYAYRFGHVSAELNCKLLEYAVALDERARKQLIIAGVVENAATTNAEKEPTSGAEKIQKATTSKSVKFITPAPDKNQISTGAEQISSAAEMVIETSATSIAEKENVGLINQAVAGSTLMAESSATAQKIANTFGITQNKPVKANIVFSNVEKHSNAGLSVGTTAIAGKGKVNTSATIESADAIENAPVTGIVNSAIDKNKTTTSPALVQASAAVENAVRLEKKRKRLEQPTDDLSKLLPVSFKLFKKYVKNLDAIVQQMLLYNEHASKSEDECAFKYFTAFYMEPTIREKFECQIKPCPAKLRQKLLSIPTIEDESEQELEHLTEPQSQVETVPQSALQSASDSDLSQAELLETETVDVNSNSDQSIINQPLVVNQRILITLQNMIYEFPVSLQTFKMFINYDSLKLQLAKAYAKNKQKSSDESILNDERSNSSLLRRYYHSFYIDGRVRKLFKFNFNAAPVEFRSKLLEYAVPLVEATKESNTNCVVRIKTEKTPTTETATDQELDVQPTVSVPQRSLSVNAETIAKSKDSDAAASQPPAAAACPVVVSPPSTQCSLMSSSETSQLSAANDVATSEANKQMGDTNASVMKSTAPAAPCPSAGFLEEDTSPSYSLGSMPPLVQSSQSSCKTNEEPSQSLSQLTERFLQTPVAEIEVETSIEAPKACSDQAEGDAAAPPPTQLPRQLDELQSSPTVPVEASTMDVDENDASQSPQYSNSVAEVDENSDSQSTDDFYPVSFNIFSKMLHLDDVVKQMQKESQYANKSNDECKRIYFDAFYRTPEIRQKYVCTIRPCPSSLRSKILELPQLQPHMDHTYDKTSVSISVSESSTDLYETRSAELDKMEKQNVVEYIPHNLSYYIAHRTMNLRQRALLEKHFIIDRRARLKAEEAAAKARSASTETVIRSSTAAKKLTLMDIDETEPSSTAIPTETEGANTMTTAVAVADSLKSTNVAESNANKETVASKEVESASTTDTESSLVDVEEVEPVTTATTTQTAAKQDFNRTSSETVKSNPVVTKVGEKVTEKRSSSTAIATTASTSDEIVSKSTATATANSTQSAENDKVQAAIVEKGATATVSNESSLKRVTEETPNSTAVASEVNKSSSALATKAAKIVSETNKTVTAAEATEITTKASATAESAANKNSTTALQSKDSERTITESTAVNKEKTIASLFTTNLTSIDFFSPVGEEHTLKYLIYTSHGLKQTIWCILSQLTFAEFQKYTSIYNGASFYEDERLMNRVYCHAIRKGNWFMNLYVKMAMLKELLLSKDVQIDVLDLAHISPKILHSSELMRYTNFDDIAESDYRKRTGGNVHDLVNLFAEVDIFYEKCWTQDQWIHQVPQITAQELLQHVTTNETVAQNIPESPIPICLIDCCENSTETASETESNVVTIDLNTDSSQGISQESDCPATQLQQSICDHSFVDVDNVGPASQMPETESDPLLEPPIARPCVDATEIKQGPIKFLTNMRFTIGSEQNQAVQCETIPLEDQIINLDEDDEPVAAELPCSAKVTLPCVDTAQIKQEPIKFLTNMRFTIDSEQNQEVQCETIPLEEQIINLDEDDEPIAAELSCFARVPPKEKSPPLTFLNSNHSNSDEIQDLINNVNLSSQLMLEINNQLLCLEPIEEVVAAVVAAEARKQSVAVSAQNVAIRRQHRAPKATVPTKRPRLMADNVPQLRHDFRPLPLMTAAPSATQGLPTTSTSQVQQQSQECAIPMTASQELAADNTLMASSQLQHLLDAPHVTFRQVNELQVDCNRDKNDRQSLPVLHKHIAFSTLQRFMYFESLTTAQITKYQINSLSLGSTYQQALICANGRLCNVYGSLLEQLFPHLTRSLQQDLQSLLSDVGEFSYNCRYNLHREAQEDLRTRVLYAFMRTAPPFAHIRLQFENETREWATFSGVSERDRDLMKRQPKCDLRDAFKPEIIQRMKEVKSSILYK